MIMLMIILYIREPDPFGEKHQKGKPNNNSPTNTISININDDLQSWLKD